MGDLRFGMRMDGRNGKGGKEGMDIEEGMCEDGDLVLRWISWVE